MISIVTGLWDSCLDKALCFSIGLNLKWGWGEVHRGLVLLKSTLQNRNLGSGRTLWSETKTL